MTIFSLDSPDSYVTSDNFQSLTVQWKAGKVGKSRCRAYKLNYKLYCNSTEYPARVGGDR
jgi:hypothetical protein